MTGGPLVGTSVVVTRPRIQATGLAELLTALGASVVELPVIAVEAPADGGAALSAAAEGLVGGEYAWAAVTSVNAARRLVGALGGRAVPAPVRWAAVGPGTAGALVDAGITPALVPGEAVATALADAFPQGDGHGAVLFPRAEVVEADLAARLRAKGWRVDEVVAYRTVDGHPTPTALAAARRADAITFTSSSTVRSTMAVLTPDQVPPVVATIGPVTSASARAAGLEVAVEADPHTVAGMVDALVSVLGGGRGRRP